MNWILEQLGLMTIKDYNTFVDDEIVILEDQVERLVSRIEYMESPAATCQQCFYAKRDLEIQKKEAERLQREVDYWKRECLVARGRS